MKVAILEIIGNYSILIILINLIIKKIFNKKCKIYCRSLILAYLPNQAHINASGLYLGLAIVEYLFLSFNWG